MSIIVNKKFDALKNIFYSYENYKGTTKSKLETEIENLKAKLTQEEYTRLIAGFKDYSNYIFNALANTQRVFIKLDNKPREINFDELNQLFEDVDKI